MSSPSLGAARMKVFLFTTLLTLVVIVGSAVLWAGVVIATGTRFGDWVWLIPVLAVSSLVVQPAWGAAVAGVAAAGVLVLGFSDEQFVSYDVVWSLADIAAGVGLVILALLLARGAFRTFPGAMVELREITRRMNVRAAKTEA
jgi:hypothetical protein